MQSELNGTPPIFCECWLYPLPASCPLHNPNDILSGEPVFLESDFVDAGLEGQPSTPLFELNPSEAMVIGSLPQPIVASAQQLAASYGRRINAGPGEFVCSLCFQDFTAKHNLKNHMNSHYRKKNHTCKDGCGASFATKSSLNRHLKWCRGKFVALSIVPTCE